tara:strand:- start:1607 stop:2359 length:753 start_codon:yes stop_codon:yes gene_type:complete
MIPDRIDLSLVLPMYNEEAAAQTVVTELVEALDAADIHARIVVVDDGSTDGTSEITERLSEAYENVDVIHHGVNRGYGAAISSGIRSATGKKIGFLDGDGQFVASDVVTAFWVASHVDCVLGYRSPRADNAYRRLVARVGNAVGRTLVPHAVVDIDCSLKIFSASLLDGLRVSSSGGFFSTELLARVLSSDLAVAQVPVRHTQRRGGAAGGGSVSAIVFTVWEGSLFALRRFREHRSQVGDDVALATTVQ